MSPLPGGYPFRRAGSGSPQSAGAASPPGRPPTGGRASDPPGNRNGSPTPGTPGAAPPPSNPVRQKEERQRSAQLNRKLMQRRPMAAKHHTLRINDRRNLHPISSAALVPLSFTMQKNQSPPPQTNDPDTVQQLNALAWSSGRARLRALLPLVDSLVNQGVPYTEIVATLAKAGILLKAKSLRQARWRWRQQQPKSGLPFSPRLATPSTSPLPPAGNLQAPKFPSEPGRISSKADLVQLRTSAESIDLTQLAELGRQK